MIDKDYDSYVMNILDNTRIQPLLEQIRLNDLSFKFFISSVYWTSTSYDAVQRHNKEIRRTIRSFFKDDIRMWFFIEKHQEHSGFHRHILLEDASSSRWKEPTTRMKHFLMEDPESFFAATLGDGLNDSQKMELLKKVFRLLPFIPNGQSGLDIRHIHNLEKLTGYCSKQFEIVRPAYEVIDPVSSDMDITYLLTHKQDGTHWKPRYEAIPPRPHQSLPRTPKQPVLAGLKPI
tara:strand:+ start:499 stop:1197 length:699 start_codon:yes stop_codon:yes gene_type:complete